MQFALILLLLCAAGCRPAELVDAKKKKSRRTLSLDNDKTCADDVDDESFDDPEIDTDADLRFDGDQRCC